MTRIAVRRSGAALVLWLASAALGLPAAAQQGTAHAGPVSALAAGPDAVLSGGFDGRAILWDAQASQARAVIAFHTGNLSAVALLPGGGFVTGGQDGRVAIWGDDARAPLLVLADGRSPVSALAVSEDGGLIAAGFRDGRILTFERATGTLHEEMAHPGGVSGLAVLEAGDLVSVGADLRFRRWTPALSLSASAGLPDLPNGLARIDTRIAVIFADGSLRTFSADGTLLPERFLTERPLVAVAAAPERVAAAAIDGTLWLLEPRDLATRARIEGTGSPVWALALTPQALFAAGAEGVIRRHSPQDGALIAASAAGGRPGADPAPDDTSRGAQVFRACAICHSLAPGDHSRAGPSLHGVFGRAIGTAEGYAFSDALRALDIIWTPQTLSELFTVGPEVYTPGSRMPDQRVGDPADRAALVDFLARVGG